MAAARTVDVFVYGSLMRGECNHGLLADARFAGPARTEPGYALLDLGAYPGMIREGDGRVVGEVYRVDPDVMARLDALERVPDLYVRAALRLEDGRDVVAYLYVGDRRGARPHGGGDWRRR